MKIKQLLSVALFMLVLTPLFAQQSGIVRFPLQTQEFNVPGRIAIQARVEIEPGIEGGKHTHPGLEMAYVIEGQLEVKVDGQPTHTYNTHLPYPQARPFVTRAGLGGPSFLAPSTTVRVARRLV